MPQDGTNGYRLTFEGTGTGLLLTTQLHKIILEMISQAMEMMGCELTSSRRCSL